MLWHLDISIIFSSGTCWSSAGKLLLMYIIIEISLKKRRCDAYMVGNCKCVSATIILAKCLGNSWHLKPKDVQAVSDTQDL
ncbi:hypothetical protein OPV22_020044 [Ensete ventricosum]|uniref:Uncharacterized protein n=1 Tax=Ensete ventricosum TaxID=4639 RepID=A0AAV8QMC9_ENSVE|nr:hypothetical protein OPV22_020044 [Ensete ventricosum]